MLHKGEFEGEAGFMDKLNAYRIKRVPVFMLLPFIPPGIGQQQLEALKVFPKAFDDLDFRDNGTLCEIKG